MNRSSKFMAKTISVLIRVVILASAGSASLIVIVALTWLFPKPAISSNNIINALYELFSPGRRRNAQTREPSRPKSASSRTEICAATSDELSLISLVPVDEISSNTSLSNERIGYVEELTIQSSPTIWFYVPYIFDDNAGQGKLNVLDSHGNLVLGQSKRYRISETPGFIGVEFPIELQENENYRWYFEIICDENVPSRNPRVDGFVRLDSRLASEIPDALNNSNGSSETYSYQDYLQRIIWYDMVNALAHANLETSNDQIAKRDWEAMLQFLSVDHLSDKPILSCCSVIEDE